MMLALWSGQRQGDLLRLPWSAYDGRCISVCVNQKLAAGSWFRLVSR